jgi:hypothetical protein
MPRKIWFTLHLFFADARKSIFNRTRTFNFHFKMKRTLRILPLLVLFGLTVQIGLAQETNRAHATFSAFTIGKNSGHIFKVDSISSEGICATAKSW